MSRAQSSAIALALVAVVVGVGLGSGGHGDPQPEPTGASVTATAATSALLVVYVSGWVETPGVVELATGSIVADAVAAAGGAREGASLDAINLAETLSAGQHIAVPGPGAQSAVEAVEDGDGRVAINAASATELEALPGVGPVLAERIVAYREANGPFRKPEDLLDVPGIGEAKLGAIRDLITIP
jgi:competence protein ComEA